MFGFIRMAALIAGALAGAAVVAGADPRPASGKDAHGVRARPEWSRAFACGYASRATPPKAPTGIGVSVYPSPPWVAPGLRSYADAMIPQTGTPRSPVLVVHPHASVTILRLPPDPDACLDTSRTTLKILRFHSK